MPNTGPSKTASVPTAASEIVTWDSDVPQLGLRQRDSSRSWIVQWRQDTRSRKRTLGPSDKIGRDAARCLARDLLAHAADADLATSTDTVAAFSARYLADRADSWKPATLRAHTFDVERLILPHLGSIKLQTLSRDDVVSWRSSLPCSPASGNRALAVLSGMIRHAELLGLRPPGRNPCKGLRRRRSGFAATYLSQHQWEKLGAALRDAASAHSSEVGCLRFLALTGCRKGEALGLTWDMIDGARCVLPDAKTGPRSIWLGRPSWRLLAGFPKCNVYVFGHGAKPLPVHHLDAVWRAARTRAGLDAVRLHDLRHSFASAGVNAGLDLRIVGGLLGHADLKTTEGYAHLEDSTLKAASQRVGDHLERVTRSPQKRQPPRSIFAEFCKSPLSLASFCAENQRDPAVFRKELIAWRKAAKGERP
ncbi:MAG: site-specific integrase [Rhodobacteraceae bacterium]|nr:site-specific integrase [Paracoccaceae bacterium]